MTTNNKIIYKTDIFLYIQLTILRKFQTRSEKNKMLKGDDKGTYVL